MNKLYCFILISIPFLAQAQVVSDAKLWTGITISKEINDFTFSFAEDVRLDENMTHVDKVFAEVGAAYKIVKEISIEANYRYSRDNVYETSSYNIRHRIDASLTYKKKFNDYRISFKTKIQTKSADLNENNPTYSRNKISLKYKASKKIMPYISYEIFYQFNEEQTINRTRFALGNTFKLNKNNAFKFFYLFENRINAETLKHNHIYGISYSLEL